MWKRVNKYNCLVGDNFQTNEKLRSSKYSNQIWKCEFDVSNKLLKYKQSCRLHLAITMVKIRNKLWLIKQWLVICYNRRLYLILDISAISTILSLFSILN